MEAWKTLRKAIPDGSADAVAHRLHKNGDQVRRWRREPLSDEAPLASGQASALDRLCQLMDAVFLSYPLGAAFIAEHVRAHHARLIADSERKAEEWDRRAHAALALSEAVDAINCLNLEAPDDETERELIEAREILDKAILHLRTRRGQSGATGPRPVTMEPARDGTPRTGSTGGPA